MPVASSSTLGNGPAFPIAAGLVYEAIAKACSSPQTTELNADKRAPTLMKWVNIGTAEGIALVIVAAYIDRSNRVALLAGGAVAAAITYAEYVHAKSAGLKNGGASTESY